MGFGMGFGIWDLGWDGMGWDGMGWDFEWAASISCPDLNINLAPIWPGLQLLQI